jgi:4-alpha-glucanotransferase
MRFPNITRFLTGVAIPVSSLRSRFSCGIGEFPDLVLLGEWCRRTGLDLIQILPVNDTGFDPSPYNARSAFALNPVYIRLEDLPGWEICRDDIREARLRFEAPEKLQYRAVLDFKLAMLERIFRRNLAAISADKLLRQWMHANPWLDTYAEYAGEKNSLFYGWIQFHLERQLTAAAHALNAMGIALKGDIPILLSPQSADVQFNPSLFNTSLRVGAPPDMFSKDGQNWRFPSFRWQEMERDDYAWWRNRVDRASRFFHACRIDHVLGFFRVWVIPESVDSAALGFYEPAKRISGDVLSQEAGLEAHEIEELVQSHAFVRTETGYAPAWYWHHSPVLMKLDDRSGGRLRALIHAYWNGQEEPWREHGRRVLGIIAESTDMLLCGEDLGVIPNCVPEVLDELNILGLRVERWSDRNGRLCNPSDYPRLTVSTTSTHDSSTLRCWWQEHGWNRLEYFASLNLPGDCPDYLTTEVCAAIVERQLNSNSLIVVFPLQDLFALHYDLRTMDPHAERINVPGVESENNWTYRMKLPIEALLAYDSYNDYLLGFITRRRNKMLSGIPSLQTV